jgi:hypothetical protein
MAQPRLWARHGFYRRGRFRKLTQARESPVGLGLSLGVSQVKSEDKMAADLQMVTLLFYNSPIFSLIMTRVRAEDPELG